MTALTCFIINFSRPGSSLQARGKQMPLCVTCYRSYLGGGHSESKATNDPRVPTPSPAHPMQPSRDSFIPPSDGQDLDESIIDDAGSYCSVEHHTDI